MKRFSLFGFAAVAMLIVGCTKDIDTDIVKDEIVRGELVTKTLVIEDSRVERDEVTGKLSWNEGDKVSVILKNNGKYTLDTEKYTVNFVNGEAEVTVPDNAAYMFYPATTITAISEAGVATLNLLQTYTIATPDAIFDYTVMKGAVDGDFVTFSNLMGYLKVPLTGEGTLNKLTVKSEIFNGFNPLSRSLNVDLTAKDVTFTLPSTNNEARTWVAAKFSNGLDLSASPAVYVPVPANTYANLALVIETDEGATTIYANNSHTISRSKVKPVASSAINVTAHTPANPTSLNGTSGDSKMDYANTYIVPPTAGEYSFEVILADGTPLAGGVTAEIVWAEEAGLFYDFHYDPSLNTISFKTNGREGNALVTLSVNDFNSSSIIWTWLLWCTDEPEVISIAGGDNPGTTYKVMDRVIGATWAPTTLLTDQRSEKGWTETYMMNATVSSQDATDGCGLYYQYQNMMPYPRIKDIDATTNETNPNGNADHNLTNTRIAVQYGFHQYAQYWTSSSACSTITTDSNGQYRTAASKNISYMYGANNTVDGKVANTNMVWCFTPLKGHNGSNANFSQVDGEAYRLWGGSTAAACAKEIKTNHDPCPAGYMVDNYSGLYHYLGAQNNARKGYVRNPENNSQHPGGYKFYGMWLNGCKNSKGQDADLYYPCGSNRSLTICKTVGNYANMGYVYAYNTNNVTTYTCNYGGKTYTVYSGSSCQYGASGSSGTTIGVPWGGNTGKLVNGQGYNVRCRKFGN